MSNTEIKISIPLDENSFLRRECPNCKSEFKIQISEDELTQQTQSLVDNYLSEKEDLSEDDILEDEREFFCPYCGQSSSSDSWWTQAQLDYAMQFVQNLTNKIINENLIKELKKMSSSSSFVKFTGNELKYTEPWIAPEENDMEIFKLPCCNEMIKLIPENLESSYSCFYCGFSHKKDRA